MDDRAGYIGGSDAKYITEGRWLDLYNLKMGLTLPDDLSKVFRVQLGSYTEPFHIDWLATVMGFDGIKVTDDPESQLTHATYNHIRFRPDALYFDSFLETKHTNAFTSFADQVEYYLPQLAHGCAVMNTTSCLFSIIKGNTEPDCRAVEVPQSYIDQLVELENKFWWHIDQATPPLPQHEDIIGEHEPVMIDSMKSVDMTGNNEWSVLAGTIIDTKDFRDLHEKAKTDIKKLIAKDVGDARGHGIEFSRTKNGALRMNITETEKETK